MERTNYTRGILREEDLASEPLAMLRAWLVEANAAGVEEATAFCLGTVSGGRPRSRMVLLRGFDADGFWFFTNYESDKGRELSANPAASACFWWREMERQVRVEGVVSRLSEGESDAYFASRPLLSQVASALSPQSQVLSSRESLDAEVEFRLASLGGESLARPPHWGGFRFEGHVWEFWQGRPGRIHDRFRYRRDAEAWVIERLAP